MVTNQPMQSDHIVAAFDFDGTITTSDSLRDFVRYTVGRGRFAVGVMRASQWLIGLLGGVCDRGSAKARFLRFPSPCPGLLR
jgi:phosphatidylglycerophosphatase C